MKHRSYLELLAYSARPTDTGHVRGQCPECPARARVVDYKASLRLSTRTGWFRCYRCGYKGRLPGFQGFEEEPEEQDPEEWVPVYDFEEPDSYFPVTDPSRALQPARDYLKSRGVSKKAAIQAQIGYCLTGRRLHKGRIIVPMLDRDGAWMGWQGRQMHDGGIRYYTSPGYRADKHVFNESALYEDTDRPLMVVEGVYDALPYWPDAVAVLGKDMPDGQYDLFWRVTRPIVVVFDGDSHIDALKIATSIAVRQNRNVTTIKLDSGDDPSSVDHVKLRREVFHGYQDS